LGPWKNADRQKLFLSWRGMKLDRQLPNVALEIKGPYSMDRQIHLFDTAGAGTAWLPLENYFF
jgi:hypothetical protein